MLQAQQSDGLLQVLSNRSLQEVEHVVMDEVHERSEDPAFPFHTRR